MADIAAADVTYTMQGHTNEVDDGSRFNATFRVQFGDGALTYPSGGVPLTKAKLGCPNQIESISFADMGSGDGYLYKLDYANAKVRIYQGDNDGTADGPAVELGNVAVAATSLYINVKGW